MSNVNKVGRDFDHVGHHFTSDAHTGGQAQDKTLCETICCCFSRCFPGEEEHPKPGPSPIRSVSLDSPQRRPSIPSSVGLQKLSEKPLPHKSSHSSSSSTTSTTQIVGNYMG